MDLDYCIKLLAGDAQRVQALVEGVGEEQARCKPDPESWSILEVVCHLLDEDSGEYNRDYVKHIFPGQTMLLITLAQREQGLLLQPGNPRQMNGLKDLEQEDINIVNRQPGSGTRLWLDRRLKTMSLTPSRINGYQWTVDTHEEVGQAIAEGKADAGVGLLASAQKFELDFLPLFDERFELKDRIVSLWSATGTNDGPLNEKMPATGKKVSFSGLAMSVIENGKIIEEWAYYNQLPLYSQMGYELVMKKVE